MPRDEKPKFDRGSRRDRPRRPRGDDSRPRKFDRDDRRDGSRPRSFDRDDRRPRREGDRRDDRRPRKFDRDDRRDDRRPRRDDGPDTRTDAQRRAHDVRQRKGPRRYGKNPYPPAQHSKEKWTDEGSVFREERKTARRRTGDDRQVVMVSVKNVEPSDANEIREQLGPTAERAIERLARALHAFEAHRYSEARKLIMPLLGQVSNLAIIHEVAGLSMYRLGRWQDAAEQLEIAKGLKPGEVINHPVLADCYRALRRYEKVDELWQAMKLNSPSAPLLAEGRIVAAGALADQGELQSAVRMMTHGTSDPHKVQEHHLREWYVLADLYDRAGDVASARRLFLKIQKSDAKFADVADRLNTLGE